MLQSEYSTETSTPTAQLCAVQCFCFQILTKCFFDTLIQKMCFQIIKLVNFWGDLNDISAEKEALEPLSVENYG